MKNMLDPILALFKRGFEKTALRQTQQAQALFALLTPWSVEKFNKCRVGSPHDGGYVMVDDFYDIDGAISVGIGDDMNWDLEMATKAIPVHMYDHAMKAVVTDNQFLKFHLQAIVAIPGKNETGISQALAKFPKQRACSKILKVDIEGAEWRVLEFAERGALDSFRQIVCEFHGLEHFVRKGRLDRPIDIFARIKEKFEVVHIHGNNYAGVVEIGSVSFPAVFEVTFANRAAYRFKRCDEIFPTPLDRPNNPDRQELLFRLP